MSYPSYYVNKVFGDSFQFAESLAETTTTNASFQQRLRLTTDDLPEGNYKIEWSSDFGLDDNDQGQARIQENDTTTLGETLTKMNTDGDNQYTSFSGHAIRPLTGVNFFDIDYNANGTGSNTARIRNVRMNLYRVS